MDDEGRVTNAPSSLAPGQLWELGDGHGVVALLTLAYPNLEGYTRCLVVKHFSRSYPPGHVDLWRVDETWWRRVA